MAYHASYIRFAERGRTEYLRAAGYENSTLAKDRDLMFVVRHLEATYHRPAVLDDQLSLESRVESLNNSSFMMKQMFYDLNRDNALTSDMKVTLVGVSAKTLKPVRLPDDIRAAFKSDM